MRLPRLRRVSAGERAQHLSVLHFEPFGPRNRRSLEFDGYSEPARRRAMYAARDSGSAVLTERVRLLQDDGDGP